MHLRLQGFGAGAGAAVVAEFVFWPAPTNAEPDDNWGIVASRRNNSENLTKLLFIFFSPILG
jgi:hypothetical protein